MKLFWKIYLAVFVSLLVLAFSVSYLTASGHIAPAVLALAAIAVILYYILKYFVEPFQPPAEGAEIMAKGNLNSKIPQCVQAEKILSENKERLEKQAGFLNSILESLTHPFYVINVSDHSIVMANSAAGVDSSAGRVTCYALTHRRDKPCDDVNDPCPLEIAKKTRKPVTVEHIHYDKTGNPRHVEVRAYPILDADDNVSHVIEYSLDITDRKNTEQALQKKITELNSFLNNIPDMAWLKDINSNFIAANKAFGDAVGMDPEYLVNHTCDICFGPEAAQKFKDDDKRIMATKKQTVIEESIIDAKKNTVWLETVKSPILDASGNVTGTVGIARNITERKKIEAALRQSGERFKQVAENAGEWIWEINAEGLYTYSNHIIEELLGYKVQEVVGKKHFYDFFAPDIREEFKKAALEAFDRRESFRNFINHNIHKNGSTVIFETNGTPIVDDKGNLCGYRGADRDITDRKLSEQKQAQLVQQLESVNKELRDFAYIVSHDLKAPLRAVKVLVDWLSTDYADKLDEDGKEQMTLLDKRVDRMHNLIDGIMQYSRIGRTKEQNVRVDLNELVPEVIDLLAPPANITITTQANLPAVLCDKTRISQVFQNLLSNAVKYMDKPHGQVEVACVEENGFWKFSVADNGPGIEEQYFEKIFQMFQTLASRDDYESTGVGLTVAKKIVEMFGGKIWVESKVGHGSTFFFTLPKQQEEIKDEKFQTCIVN